jgi:uncharacterized membrane protein
MCTLGVFSKEAIRAYTAVLLWFRQTQILQLLSWTGSFCYLLTCIAQAREGLGLGLCSTVYRCMHGASLCAYAGGPLTDGFTLLWHSLLLSQDVIKWLVIFAFAATSFAAGMFVLFQNQRPAIGPRSGRYTKRSAQICT